MEERGGSSPQWLDAVHGLCKPRVKRKPAAKIHRCLSEIGRDINGPRIVLCDCFERSDALQTPIAATHATVEVAMPHKVSCLAKSAVGAKKQALFYSA